jgi:hypothetical protein
MRLILLNQKRSLNWNNYNIQQDKQAPKAKIKNQKFAQEGNTGVPAFAHSKYISLCQLDTGKYLLISLSEREKQAIMQHYLPRLY